MRKEVVIVILIGVIIGTIVAYGIYTAQTAIKRYKGEAPSPSTLTSSPTPTPVLHTLTISEPPNESISEVEKVTVIGRTSPEAVVTLIAEENEYLLTADDQGNFAVDVSLIGGANTIKVTAFDVTGNRAEATLTVVYSTEL